jgi:hypothetical protein
MTSPARGNLRPVYVAALAGLLLGALVFLFSRGDESPDPGVSGAPIVPSGLSSGGARPTSSLPPEAVGTQGGRYFAVFIALAAEANDPKLLTAQERAQALGYSGGIGELECTKGAREQLKVPAGRPVTAYSIFFSSRDRADRFVAAYGAPVVGTAVITAGCLD